MEKGKYIKKGEGLTMIARGWKMRALSLEIKNEGEKRIHIKAEEIKLLSELTNKMNLRNL